MAPGRGGQRQAHCGSPPAGSSPEGWESPQRTGRAQQAPAGTILTSRAQRHDQDLPVDACPRPVGPAALHICTRPCPAAGGDPGSHGAGPKDTPSNRTRAFTANFPHTKFTPEEGTISMTEEQEAGDGDSFPPASVGRNILGLGPAGAGAWALPLDGR